jgi:PAS domain S-box-containing protein
LKEVNIRLDYLFLIFSAGIMLSGFAAYLMFNQKEIEVDRRMIKTEKQLNALNRLYQTYLKTVKDENAYLLNKNEFYRSEYVKSKSSLNEFRKGMPALLDRPDDQKLYATLDSGIDKRLQQLDRQMNYRTVFSPEQARQKILEEEPEAVQTHMSTDAGFEGLISRVEERSAQLIAERDNYTEQNYKGFVVLMFSSILLLVITVVQTSRRIRLAERDKQVQRVLDAVQASEEKLQNVIAATNTGTWEWNVQTGEIKFNERWANIAGYSLAELEPVNFKTWENLTHPDDQVLFNRLLQDCFERKTEFYDCEYRMKHKSGRWVWVHDRGKVTTWTPEGKPLWMFGTTAEITARKNAEEDLKMINEKLKSANEELEKFASIASHDMREPLRMIKSFMDLLEKDYAPQLDDKARKYIHFARDGAQRMTNLVNDLLSHARTGFEGALQEEVDVNELIDEIKNLQKPVLEEKKATLVYPSLPRVRGVRTALLLLFQNLINNAIKFQLPDVRPVITIRGEEKPDCWQFTVQDNGIGISLQHRDRIFGLFQRAHGSAYQGSGMGLATCKKIVEQHGGAIHVESEEGKGSTFYFSLAKK